MSLSRAQVQFVVNTGKFDEAIGSVLRLLGEMSPLIWHLRLARQRDRSRAVTRRKQRRNW